MVLLLDNLPKPRKIEILGIPHTLQWGITHYNALADDHLFVRIRPLEGRGYGTRAMWPYCQIRPAEDGKYKLVRYSFASGKFIDVGKYDDLKLAMSHAEALVIMEATVNAA